MVQQGEAGRAPGRIDVHHHFCPPGYVREIGGRIPLQPVLRTWTPAGSLEDMDRGGVGTAILSITTPGLWFGDDAAARRLARACNDDAAAIVRDHPSRFGLFAALPLPDVEGSLEEISYALDVLKADGVAMFTSYGRKWLGDAALSPVFQELDRRKAVVYTHPTINDCCKDLIPGVNESIVEYGTDTTRTIASFVFSGAAARFPNVRMIFSHAGGTMPFLIERFVNLAKAPEVAARLPRGILHELRRFYYDTAQASNPGAMSSLRHLVPASQILFGTDFPYRSAEEHVVGLRTCGFATRELEGVERDNASELLG